MIKKMSFGKVDGYRNGRKSCEVELEFGYREFANQDPYFTVCASLWNNIHSDIIWGGQCVEELAKEFESLATDKLYNTIIDLWKKYHLKRISDIPAADKKIIDEIINA